MPKLKPLAHATEMVRAATAADLDSCFEIEESLRETRKEAELHGFLLSGGDQRGSYPQFLDSKAFYVFELDHEIVGFIFALAPDSQRVQSFKQHPEKFLLEDHEIFDQSNLAWLAKVGVRQEFMGRGIASALYQVLLAQHKDWSFLTTTVRSPVRNLPSERLQAKFGFIPVGTLPMGARGALNDVICTVHYRQANLLDD